MDSLQDILSRHGPAEQPELVAIKRYIYDQYRMSVGTAISGETITITVSSAALASTLRMNIRAIRNAAGTNKRLTFRIG